MSLTLQELLAGVFAEESVVNNGSVKVVNHELEDRLNFLLGVAGVDSKSGIPLATLEDSTGEIHGGSSDMTRRVLKEAVVETANLKQVLAERTGLDVVVVGLGDAAKEVHGVGVREVVVEGTQDETLGLKDLSLGEAIVGNVLEVLDVGREDFLVLGSNEHGGDTNQLETVELDNLARKEAVDDVDSQEEGLRQQPKARVNLQKPVDKDATHLPFEFVLAVHVVGVGESGDLKLLHVVKDFVHVLSDHERIIKIFRVEVLGLFRKFLEGLVVKLIVVQGEVLGGEEGLALLSSNTVLRRRDVLGYLFVKLGDSSRLGSRGVALLDNRATDTRTAGRSLQVRGCGVGRLGAEGSPRGGGSTSSRLLHASGLCSLGCKSRLAQSLLRVRGLDRLVLCNVADISEGSTLAGAECAISGCGSGALGDGGLLRRVTSSVSLKSSSFSTRQARGADWYVLCVLVGDTPAGSDSRLEDMSVRDRRRH